MEYTMAPVTEIPVPTADTVQYAGFWRRFLAYILDSILCWVVFTPLSLAFGVAPWKMAPATGPEAVAHLMAAFIVLIPLEIAGIWLYFALMESSKNQATLGKMALGLRVTDTNGNRISFGRASGRYWAKFLSAMTLFIGYIMAGFTQKKQALHDMVASTLVLRKESSVPAQVAANAYPTN